MTSSEQAPRSDRKQTIAIKWWRQGLWPRFALVLVGVILLQIEPVPRIIRENVIEARRAVEAGNYDTAVRRYQAIYNYHPWGSEHLTAIAYLDLYEGRYAETLAGLNGIESIRPLTPEEIGWRGNAYAGLGEFEHAVRDWEQAWEQGGLDTAGLEALVNYYAAQNAWPQAVAAQQSLLTHSPADAGYYYQLALMQAISDPDLALQALSQAYALDSGLLARSKPLLDVLEDTREVTHDVWLVQLGTGYLRMEELQLAEYTLQLAIDHNPAYGEALAYLAYVQDRRGKAALAPIQQALALAPDNPTVQYLAGLVWKSAGDNIQARRHLTKALAIDTQNPAFAVEIARTYQATGDLINAELWHQHALTLAPGNEQFQLLLLQLYVDEGYALEDTALPLAQALVERYPDNAEAHDALGWAYFQTGEIAAAEAAIAYALELDPELARAHYHKGTLFELDGQLSFALWHYERTIEYDTGGAFAALANRAIQRLTEQ